MDLHARAVATDRLCVTIASHADLTLLLDLDGTLIPFAARVEDASLDAGAVRLLGALHDAGIRPRCSVRCSTETAGACSGSW